MSFTCKEPKLRFPEFSGEWVEKKFEDIFSFSTGKNIKQNEASPDFEIPCIRYGELYHMYGDVISKVINKTNIDKSELLFSDGNEILMPSAGEDPLDIGSASALTVKNVAIGRTINILRPLSNNVYSQKYVAYYINQKLRKKISTLAKGSSISNVYNSDLRKLKLNLPSKPEQEKIASFLTVVDAKIEQLTCKDKLLQKYKKSAMQKLFSQELRFTCNDGSEYPEWEEKKLGELDIYVSDGNYGEMYPKADEMKSSGIPFIRANNIKNLKLSWQDMKYIDEDLHSVLTSGHLKTNDILVTTRGDIGMLAYVTEDFNNSNINAQICLLRCKENLNSFYLLQFLASVNGFNQFKTLQTGSALKQLPKKSLNDIKAPIPDLEEQTKIANFLSAIDEKCLHVKSQLEQTRQFKKALLQQMFV